MRQIILLQNLRFFIFILGLPVVFWSCAAMGIRESPFRSGIGFNTMPGLQLGESNTSVHAVLGYSRFNFKGGGGHNNFLQVGPQIRWSLNKGSANGLWAGAEATYLNVSAKYDNSSTKPKGSAFTIGPVAGYRFELGKIPLSVYIAPAYLSRGDLKANNMVWVPASSGFYGRLGFDLHFMSLLSKKGR